MSLWRLVIRSLGFYWKTNLGVFLAAIVSTAILTGALVIGDSVRHSLRSMVTARLGRTELALVTENRFFRSELASDLSRQFTAEVAPVLQVRGLMANSDGTKRANSVVVLGVDRRFFDVGPAQSRFEVGSNHEIVVNERLAARLEVGAGQEVLLRIEKPGLMSRDIPIAPASDLTIASRLKVAAVAGKSDFGSFSLQANQVAPLNAFVPIQWLHDKLDRSAQANMLLAAAGRQGSITAKKADEAVRRCWKLADSALELRRLEAQQAFELRSTRIFIGESVTEAAMNITGEAVGILTYFVNELRAGVKATPYSTVTAMSRGTGRDPASRHASPVPATMQDDEILINQWLADDLDVEVGDSVDLTYFVIGSARKLQEQKATFRVHGILPMQDAALDPELMPAYPGLAEASNCRDWDPGIPIDLDKIRPCDEDYWDRYRGTPKAFITLEAGQKIWANRYGNLTAVRYPLAQTDAQIIAEKLLSSIDPASSGLFFQPVRQRGLEAANKATDFGQLFLGLSMFLIVAALVLMGLVFVFGVENRSEQTGVLLALGFPPRSVRRLLLAEGGMLAAIGAVVGSAAGLLYTKAMIHGLATNWQQAVGGSAIEFYAKPLSLSVGASLGIAVSIVAIWLTVRKQGRQPARELLAGSVRWQFFTAGRVAGSWFRLSLAAIAVIGALLLVLLTGTADSSTVSAVFFGAGALLLIAGLSLTGALLRIAAGSWRRPVASLSGLGLRNSTRRSGRSLAVVGLLACGAFLVIAVGANRQDPLADAGRRDSGTGGFALFGESAVPIVQDLNSESGRQSVGLEAEELDGVGFVQLRAHEGDDASCLNLNRAQRPRLLGVKPEQLQQRGAFAFRKMIDDAEAQEPWHLLNRRSDEEVVPAIGDYPTIVWSLGKSVGDELEYVDEMGRAFRLRLVGMLKNSILQGSLVIAEDELVKRFPSDEGYRVILIDAPANKMDEVSDKLSARLQDYGLALTPSTQRLAEFGAVQNTYLSIFQLLGGFGLILGTVGLALVVLRNMLDRRGELAMLRAVGFEKRAVGRIVLYEHWLLCLWGLACGLTTALVAVRPAISAPGAAVPYRSLVLMVVAIALSGLVWIRLAASLALSGAMLQALRNE